MRVQRVKERRCQCGGGEWSGVGLGEVAKGVEEGRCRVLRRARERGWRAEESESDGVMREGGVLGGREWWYEVGVGVSVVERSPTERRQREASGGGGVVCVGGVVWWDRESVRV